MARSEDDIIIQLEQEYIPLDSALIRALVSDYDLHKASDLQIVREYLDTLRASAVAEDAGSFDPSGTSSFELPQGKNSNKSTISASRDTESTSVDTRLSSLSLGSTSGFSSTNSEVQALDDYAALGEDAKLSILKELYPTLRGTDIAFTLKKCDYDINKAMDVLLNQVFFEESYASDDPQAIVTRGIEAFSEDHNIHRGRKKKKNKNKMRKLQGLDDDYAQSSSMPAQTTVNKWESASNDVFFISARVKMPASAVYSIYHENGGSQAKAIVALIEDDLRSAPNNDDIQSDSDVAELIQDFPTLSLEYCLALIRLTKPSTANAHELAKALTSSSTGAGKMALIPQYAPVKLSEVAPNTKPVSPSATLFSGDSKTLLAARSTAFDNASRYYRRGKSDRLMGGAAGYYGSLGRDYSAAIHNANAAEADALVASQSSTTHLDLHGVTVKEATRIVLERVQVWWDGLGESKIPGGGRSIGQGYRIVTGRGMHSEQGIAKVGPAVMKALLRDGWKVEAGGGELTVTGKMRR